VKALLFPFLALALVACDAQHDRPMDAGPAGVVVGHTEYCTVERLVDNGQVLYVAFGGSYTTCAIALGARLDGGAP
jgi:hypothetical protein